MAELITQGVATTVDIGAFRPRALRGGQADRGPASLCPATGPPGARGADGAGPALAMTGTGTTPKCRGAQLRHMSRRPTWTCRDIEERSGGSAHSS
jgi:hypothetical protein